MTRTLKLEFFLPNRRLELSNRTILLFTNYILNPGLGEAIAYIALAPITAILGRKKGLIFCLGISCACFLLGMIPWAWNDVWSFERLMNLAAIIGVSCAFALAFLYTNELAPTTHRGLVMSCCSVVARGGKVNSVLRLLSTSFIKFVY